MDNRGLCIDEEICFDCRRRDRKKSTRRKSALVFTTEPQNDTKPQTCPKNHHQKQKHRPHRRNTCTCHMRKQLMNKTVISLLLFLVASMRRCCYIETVAFNSFQVQVCQSRQYPKCVGYDRPKSFSRWVYLQPTSSFCPPSRNFISTAFREYLPCPKSTSPSRLLGSTSSLPSQNSPRKTQYTIDDSVCLPTKEKTLEKAVHKACRSLEIYMEKKPIAAHTRRAFDILVDMIEEEERRQSATKSSSLPLAKRRYDGIVLDSGCGTGKSTKLLASTIYPNHLVIGVDRSLARLTKTKDNRNFIDESASEGQAYCYQVSDNAYLVRAELVDFWRCCVEHGWTRATCKATDTWSDNNFGENKNHKRESNDGLKITHHYMLYPNPYPTNARLSSRWYAHPSFPLILKLGVATLIIRSNWKGYLSEFAKSVEMANEFYINSDTSRFKGAVGPDENSGECNVKNSALPYLNSAKEGPKERIDKSVSFTNFESKYDKVGESTYELVLERNTSTET